MEIQVTLTSREVEVMELVAHGASNREIADALTISIYTVKEHLRSVYNKFDVRNRTSAVAQAREQGLLSVPPAMHTVHHNLPRLPLSLIGREQELASVERLLKSGSTRLVTVLGPGGIGKTHFAIEVAGRCVSHFSDGVYLVPLASLPSAQPLSKAITTAIDEPLKSGGDDADALIAALQHKSMLLVLDNFEHLIDKGAFITELLQKTAQVVVLITSREALNITGEQRIMLSGLEAGSPGEAATSSAVRLFVRNMQQIKADFTPSSEDLRYIHHICQLMQGMPLGILMASSWVDTLPLHDIYEHLQHQPLVLLKQEASLLQKQQSLEQAFDRSWKLLSTAEQSVLMYLSVFDSDITLNAATAVAQATPALLRSLIQKSLVQTDADTRRYYLHPLIKHFARQQLQANQAHQDVYQRLFDFLYNELGFDLSKRFFSNEIRQRGWLFEIHHADVNAVLAWSIESNHIEQGVMMWLGIAFLWHEMGYVEQSYHWYGAFLPYADTFSTRLQAHYYGRAGEVFFRKRPNIEVAAMLSKSIASFEQIDEPHGHLSTSVILANIYTELGDYDAAAASYHRTLSLAEQLDDTERVLRSLVGLAALASQQEDEDSALAYQQRVLQRLRADSTLPAPTRKAMEAGTMIDIAVSQMMIGDYASAEQNFLVTMDYGHETNNAIMLMLTSANLGELYLRVGDIDKSAAHHHQALEVAMKSGHAGVIMHTVEHSAYVFIAREDYTRAAYWLGAAEAMREQMNRPLSPRDQIIHDQYQTRLQQAMSGPAIEAAWQRGRLSDASAVSQEILDRLVK